MDGHGCARLPGPIEIIDVVRVFGKDAFGNPWARIVLRLLGIMVEKFIGSIIDWIIIEI